MSFRFLCEEFYWSKQVFLPFNDLIKATSENKDFRNQLDELITFSVKLIKKEIVNTESLQNINIFVSLLEEFISYLNEVHASSKKPLLDFDVKITPLLYKYADLVVLQARLTDCQKEHKSKLIRFLNSLPIHSTLKITPCNRTAAFLTRLLSDGDSDVPIIQTFETDKEADVNQPEQIQKEVNVGNSEKVPYQNEDLKADEVNSEPSLISETPLKSSQPTCVGVAAIRGVIPITSGSLFPLAPLITESNNVCTSVKPQVENLANFPTPSRTPPLIEFQKGLRERFPTPFVTPTEKKARRDVMRILRSSRRPQISSWNVVETRSPARSCTLRKQLFIDTNSPPNSANSSSSQLALYLSPDTDTPKSVSLDSPSSRKCPTSENDKTKSPFQEKNGESYTELKKSIEGNLMGCEASLSDVELMDEIESNINMHDDVIFIDPTSKADNHEKIEYIMPKSVSPLLQDANLSESSKASDRSTTEKTLSRSSQKERRRSSRLAGIPLPLIFTTEPLPDCRRANGSKKTPSKHLSSKHLSSKEKENEDTSSAKKKIIFESVNDLAIQPFQRDSIAEPTLPSQLVNKLPQTASWKQIRLQIPTCWAELIENHVKENHPDEILRFQGESGTRWQTVYCNCAQAKPN